MTQNANWSGSQSHLKSAKWQGHTDAFIRTPTPRSRPRSGNISKQQDKSEPSLPATGKITFSMTWNTNVAVTLFIYASASIIASCPLFMTLRKIAAPPWELLSRLTPRARRFICCRLMYDIFVRATVECNHGPCSSQGPPQIACKFSREIILQKILTVGHWEPVCVLRGLL